MSLGGKEACIFCSSVSPLRLANRTRQTDCADYTVLWSGTRQGRREACCEVSLCSQRGLLGSAEAALLGAPIFTFLGRDLGLVNLWQASRPPSADGRSVVRPGVWTWAGKR